MKSINRLMCGACVMMFGFGVFGCVVGMGLAIFNNEDPLLPQRGFLICAQSFVVMGLSFIGHTLLSRETL